MSIVLQYDSRVNATYAYHNKVMWDKTLKKSSTSRILIAKLDPNTGELVKTSGKRRKKAIDEDVIDQEIAEYNKNVRGKKRVEEDILSGSSLEIQSLKQEFAEIQSKYKQFGQIMLSFSKQINNFFDNTL